VAVTPVFTLNPTPKVLTVGGTATFTVLATQPGGAAPSYAWQRSNDGGTSWGVIAGATSASYTTLTLAGSDNGALFRAIATGSNGSATSQVAGLNELLTVTAGTTSIDLVLIPQGAFTMGETDVDGTYPTGVMNSEPNARPSHTVTVGKAFYMAQVPCTQAQWLALMGSNPSTFVIDDVASSGDHLQRPVDTVDYTDITGFLTQLNATASLTGPLAGATFRLPTEVEYEYAMRAGSSGESNFHFGTYDGSFATDEAVIDTYGWFSSNNASAAYPAYPDPANPLHTLYPPFADYLGGSTHPVKQKLPNAWGLYDMIGNIWHVCQDNWHDSYDISAENPGAGVTPVAPTTDLAWMDVSPAVNYQHPYRGGVWGEPSHYAQSKTRGPYPTTNAPEASANWEEGFRVVLQLP
jgi:formylglycine-generating enzyme required for sulfatase activity